MVDSQPAGGERLLAEFPVPTLAAWHEEVVRLLKGVPFEKKMLTSTYEGITLQPIYTEADTEGLPHVGGVPGAFPFVRGTEPLGNRVSGWLVAQEIPYPTPEEIDEALRNDLGRGQTAVNLVVDAATRAGLDPDQADATQVGALGTSISSLGDLATVLGSVDLLTTPLFVTSGPAAVAVAAFVAAHLEARGAQAARVSLGFDPLGVLAHQGRLPMSLDEAWDELAGLTRYAIAKLPAARTLAACGRAYHEAGASAVQELAFTLASGVEALRGMEARGLDVDATAPRLQFRLAVGGNFFMEIAKLRAARLLWAQVVRAAGGSDASARMALHVRGGRFNKTRFDAHVNLLRGTTEAFAAVVGGCDSLHVALFDELLGQPSDLSRRIARNTQLVLREEARLDQVVDLAGGSWAVERLTHEVATAAWKLFQETEELGGLTKALEQGFVQKTIGETSAAKRKAVALRQDVVVGINQYVNAGEGLPDARPVDGKVVKALLAPRAAERRKTRPASSAFGDLVAAAPGTTVSALVAALGRKGETKIAPLGVERAAEAYETLREAVVAWRTKAKGPQIFLANLGPIGAYMPRLDFTRGFFQVGGFEVASDEWWKTPHEAAAAAIASRAPVVVLVGLDDTNVEAVPVAARALKASSSPPKVIVAGFPKDHVESMKAAGVDDFIHIKSDVHAVLSGLARSLGALR